MRSRTFRLAFWAGAALGLPLSAYCGTLDISPLRIGMTPQKPNSALTLRNPGDAPILVHAELMQWRPPEVYRPSRDVLVNPVIFTIPAKGMQIVRLGINTSASANAGVERAYRLFLQEVPPPAPKGSTVLRTALRFGIPVFLPPSRPESKVDWSARRLSKGRIRIQAINRGNVHLQVQKLEAVSAGKRLQGREGRQYLLPGELRHWIFEGAEGSRKSGGVVEVTARTDEGELHATLKIPSP